MDVKNGAVLIVRKVKRERMKPSLSCEENEETLF